MSGRPLRVALVVLLTLAAGACNFGARPDDFPTAASPAGARVVVSIRGELTQRSGELYSADAAGIVLRSGRLLSVSWPQVAAMDVQRLGSDFDVAPGEIVTASKWERLALVSRFPQGLNGALLQRVLALMAQPQLDSLR